MGFFSWLFGEDHQQKENGGGIDVTPPPPPPLPSLEVFSLPGHGKSSFIWAFLYMLRQLTQVLPQYLCWPYDGPTGEAFKAIHDNLLRGYLPPSEEPEETIQYHVDLKNLRPWGDRQLVLWDRVDPVFSGVRSEDPGEVRPIINWRAQPVWLLSLSDLDEVRGRFLDLLFEDLVRARLESGPPFQIWPFRLVIVLTKADCIPDLPQEVRCFLKEDPLTKLLCAGDGDLFRQEVNPELVLSKTLMSSGHDAGLLNFYLESMRQIDVITREWLESCQAGRMLVRRAEHYRVDLHFSVVSSTGTGVSCADGLGTRWRPRRVLDPYFWSLELDRLMI